MCHQNLILEFIPFIYSDTIIKYLHKLEKEVSKRIVEKIETLKENPVPHNAKKLVNIKDNTFRIRVGKYRILYRLEKDKVIVIFLINKRSKVYKK